MKQLLVILSLVSFTASANAADYCEEGRYGEWTLLDYAVNVWECDIDSSVGGVTLGFGPSYQVMSGVGDYTCRGYDAYGDTEVIGCYRERVAMGMIGHGVGIGLSVVNSMRTESVGIKLLDLEPENFIGFVRLGVGANAGIQLGSISSHVGAEMDFSLANGINFSMKLFEMNGLINAHIGAHLTGFAMHELDYDSETSIIVDSVTYFSGVLGRIFARLRSEGTNIDRIVFPAENVVADVGEARSRAKAKATQLEEEGGEYVTRGLRVYENDEYLDGQEMDDYIKRGLEKSQATCNNRLVKAYASFNCENSESGEKCDFAYFRAVCER